MAEHQSTAIELHDSRLHGIILAESLVRLQLWCVLHTSDGRPGLDNGVTAMQAAVISLRNANIDGFPGDLPACIVDGELLLGATRYPNMVSLPCDVSGIAVSLTLFLYPGYRKLHISATGLQVMLKGEPSTLDEFIA